MLEAVSAMPRYAAYKDSGVEWLGEIPENWNLNPGLTIFSENKRDNKGMKESQVLSLSYGNIVVKPAEKLVGLVPESFETYQLVEPGDIIIRCTDLQNDQVSLRTGLAKNKGIITSAYLNLKVKKGQNSKYWHYYLHSIDTTKVLYKFGSGLRQNLSFLDFKRLPVLEVSYEEQTTIANYLDHKTAQIDQAVAIKQQQIALLKERKQILIQHAVTRGLNPNAPQRDSGVEWIGEIPAHWEVVKLKFLFKEINERTKTGSEVLFSLRMEQGLVPHNDVSDKHIADENLVDYKIVRPGQMVMNRMRAAIGIFGLVHAHGLVSPDYAVFNIGQKAHPDFFLMLFKMPLLGTQFRLSSKGLGTGSSGFMRLYTENFGDIKVALPPMEEQTAIITHIETESAKIDRAIALQQQQIDKLKEYKATLINSAVTGKIKVTELAESKVPGVVEGKNKAVG